MDDSASHAGQGLQTALPTEREAFYAAANLAGLTFAQAEQMRAYATAAVLAERERCAQLCERMATEWSYPRGEEGDDGPSADYGMQQCADAIRAQGAIRADTKREPESLDK